MLVSSCTIILKNLFSISSRIMPKIIRISVVIPVKNVAYTIRECINGIRNQTLYDQTEIICVDSGSTDGTLSILEKFPDVRIFKIRPEEFNHGDTRNLGVKYAIGEWVVLTVGDARSADERWLEKMVRHFDDPEVAAVCGQQVVPHEPDKNPHQWFRPQGPDGVREVYFGNSRDFENLSSREKYNVCKWDDVTAVYRREVLLQIPFRRITFGEDMSWARDALSSGKKLVYDKSAIIYHYHDANFDYQYRRTLTVLYYVYKNFEYIKENPYKVGYPFHLIYWNIKYKVPIKWIGYNLILMVATTIAHRDIRRWLRQGEEHLDFMHEKICKIAPQATKQKNEKGGR